MYITVLSCRIPNWPLSNPSLIYRGQYPCIDPGASAQLKLTQKFLGEKLKERERIFTWHLKK